MNCVVIAENHSGALVEINQIAGNYIKYTVKYERDENYEPMSKPLTYWKHIDHFKINFDIKQILKGKLHRALK